MRDAAAAGPPPVRAAAAAAVRSKTAGAGAAAGREVVEAQVMTKRMLRELAMRRGVNYADLVRQAEDSGMELPDE